MVECAICLEACIKKSSPKCSQCQKQVCVRCMSKLVKVCSSGCACLQLGMSLVSGEDHRTHRKCE